MKENRNELVVEFDSRSENEGLARIIVAGFLLPINPTVDEMADVKTAVSEAVTNAIIHGYEGRHGKVKMSVKQQEDELYIEIEDYGCGICDITQAMEPLYTSKPQLERSGMGFTFMEAFMDEIIVTSEVGRGTLVKMHKKLGHNLL
ncbi:MAG: anti-sigma F factor [Lachnospiraceae bacterium]